MRWIRNIRLIAPWVLGVFVLAQLSSLLPGHYEHAGAAGGPAAMHAPSFGPNGAHHHALADSGDECCAVHATPVLPAVSDAHAPGIAATHRVPAPQRRLVAVRFAPLDPPPKLLSRV
jgi:hypothetical protein